MTAARGGWTGPPARISTPSGSSPSPVSRPRRPRPRPSATPARSATSAWSSRSRPRVGSTPITASFAGTLPAERSRLRGNRFPEPSVLAGAAGAGRAGPSARQPGRPTAGRPPARRPPRRPHRRLHPLGPAGAGAAGGARQPGRFLADRGEAERAFALAEQLGSINAAASGAGHHVAVAAQGLRPPRARHAGPQPRSRPPAGQNSAARQRTGQPVTPTLDPVFVALNPGALPARERPPAELY